MIDRYGDAGRDARASTRGPWPRPRPLPQPVPAAPDADGDGVPDARDNCPAVPNADQADGDA